MIPYCFSDFGKSVRTILEENFHVGGVKFTHCSKTASDIALTANAEHKSDSGHVSADINTVLELKYKNYNLLLSDTFTSEGVITSSFTTDCKYIEGLKNTLECNFEPSNGKYNAKVNSSMARKGFHVTCDSDFMSCLPIVTAATVLGLTAPADLMVGAQVVFDAKQSRLQKHALGLNMRLRDDFEVAATLTNSNVLTSYVSHQVNAKLVAGLQMDYNHSSCATRMVLGAHYTLPRGAFWKAKLDNTGLLGLSYGFDVANNVRMVLGASVDAKRLDGGKHQVGLALQFEA